MSCNSSATGAEVSRLGSIVDRNQCFDLHIVTSEAAADSIINIRKSYFGSEQVACTCRSDLLSVERKSRQIAVSTPVF